MVNEMALVQGFPSIFGLFLSIAIPVFFVDPRPVRVGFVVEKVEVGQAFHPLFRNHFFKSTTLYDLNN
jgi:hypothetical protein